MGGDPSSNKDVQVTQVILGSKPKENSSSGDVQVT